MKRLYITVAALALTGTAALAAPSMSAVDADGDGFASKAEIMAVYKGVTDEDFAAMDLNNDARLDPNEMLSRDAQDILLRYSPQEVTDHVESVGDIDKDGDGFASSAEMMAAYVGLTQEEFVSIDTNADGRVSPEELYASDAQQIVKEYAPGGSPVAEVSMFDKNGDYFASFEEIQAVFPTFEKSDFVEVDTNGDNRISQEEFNDEMMNDIMKKYL
jgi:hypothetical protein